MTTEGKKSDDEKLKILVTETPERKIEPLNLNGIPPTPTTQENNINSFCIKNWVNYFIFIILVLSLIYTINELRDTNNLVNKLKKNSDELAELKKKYQFLARLDKNNTIKYNGESADTKAKVKKEAVKNLNQGNDIIQFNGKKKTTKKKISRRKNQFSFPKGKYIVNQITISILENRNIIISEPKKKSRKLFCQQLLLQTGCAIEDLKNQKSYAILPHGNDKDGIDNKIIYLRIFPINHLRQIIEGYADEKFANKKAIILKQEL